MPHLDLSDANIDYQLAELVRIVGTLWKGYDLALFSSDQSELETAALGSACCPAWGGRATGRGAEEGVKRLRVFERQEFRVLPRPGKAGS